MKRTLKKVVYVILSGIAALLVIGLILAYLPIKWKIQNHGITPEEAAVLRQNYKVEFQLDPGHASTTFTDNVASVVVNFGKDKWPWDYQLLVGLQLSKAQLDYNRTVGPYTP